MKKLIVVMSMVFVLILAGCNSSDSDSAEASSSSKEKIKLKVSTHTNTEHYSYKDGIEVWMDKVKELTDDQVEFEVYTNEQIGKAKDSYSLVKNKTVDIAYVLYAEDKIPLTDIPMLPALYDTAEAGTKAYWDLSSEGGIMLDKVFLPNNIRPIFSFAVSPYTFGTIDKKIEKMEDIKGLKLRTSGGLLDIALNELKGTPTAVGISDTRQALETKTVDGIMTSWLSITPYQLENPLKYIIENAPLNGWGAFFAINEDKYKDLPQNVKDAMKQASDETVMNLASVIQEEEDKEIAYFKEQGIEVYPISDKEVDRWKKTLEPLTDEWVEKMEGKGEPAKEIYEEFKKRIDEYEK